MGPRVASDSGRADGDHVRWLLDGPHLSWDTEATGVNVETDHIVTCCTAFVQPGKPADVRKWLLAVDVDIPAEATAVHGITTELAREKGMPPAEALRHVRGVLSRHFGEGVPVVGCNLAYDTTLLDRNLRRYGIEPLDPAALKPIVDVYVLDKHLDPYRKGGRKLTDLCENYDVRIDGAHDATFDALAAGRIAWRIASMTQWSNERLVTHFRSRAPRYGARHRPQDIADRFLALSMSTPTQLHEAQVGWRAGQQAGLADYFRRQGKPVDDVYGAWPMIPWKGKI